jgi:hypothetical protein
MAGRNRRVKGFVYNFLQFSLDPFLSGVREEAPAETERYEAV